MRRTRILVVDDEPAIHRLVEELLERRGYEVLGAMDGEEALKVATEASPDLVVLDITMPRLDGFEVCRRLREWSQVAIIMLSARVDEQDKVRSLRLGADDYLVKPFGNQELVARVEAVLRRTQTAERALAEPTFASGELQVNFAERRVIVGGQEVKLTPTEYSLLLELVHHRGKVLTHGMLLNRVWGPEYGDEREYVRVFVNRLRHKLGDDSGSPRYIETEPGVGYRFLNSAQASA